MNGKTMRRKDVCTLFAPESFFSSGFFSSASSFLDPLFGLDGQLLLKSFPTSSSSQPASGLSIVAPPFSLNERYVSIAQGTRNPSNIGAGSGTYSPPMML